MYTCVAPFAFCSNFFRFTPIGAWALAVLVFSVDTIGSAIECPFGDDPEVDVDVEGALNQCLDVMETWSSGTVSEVMTEESKFHTRRNSLNPNNDTENDSNHVGEKVCRDKKSHPGGFFQARSIRADWDQTVDEPTPVHSKSATSARDMAGVELSDMNFDHDRRRSHSAVTAERSGSALWGRAKHSVLAEHRLRKWAVPSEETRCIDDEEGAIAEDERSPLSARKGIGVEPRNVDHDCI